MNDQGSWKSQNKTYNESLHPSKEKVKSLVKRARFIPPSFT
ncbi:MAG: hypothetical protein ACTSYC_00895 [Promethearchaeota archaeon]